MIASCPHPRGSREWHDWWDKTIAVHTATAIEHLERSARDWKVAWVFAEDSHDWAGYVCIRCGMQKCDFKMNDRQGDPEDWSCKCQTFKACS